MREAPWGGEKELQLTQTQAGNTAKAVSSRGIVESLLYRYYSTETFTDVCITEEWT